MATETTVYKLDKPAVAGDADAWGGLLNTDLDDLDTFLARPRIKKNAPAVGPTTTLDLALAMAFEFTVTEVTTVAISNVPATLPDTTVPYTRIAIKVTNGGAFAVTWPASFVWAGGVAPTLAVSGVNLIQAVTFDAGVTWYAHETSRTKNLLFSAVDLSTASISDTSLASFSLPANTLNRNGVGVRITFTGIADGGNNDFTLKFGSATLKTINIGPNEPFNMSFDVIRKSSGVQRASGLVFYSTLGGGFPPDPPEQQTEIVLTAPAQVDTAAILIDFRADRNSGGSFAALRTATITFLDPETVSA